MRTLFFTHGILLLFLSFFSTCMSEDDIIDGEIKYGEWMEKLNEADQKLVETPGYARFYYLNEDGTGWIDPENIETYPVTHFKETDSPKSLIREVKQDAGFWFYAKGAIRYDEEEQLYYYQSHAFLDGTHEYIFPVYWNGCTDWIKVSFLYSYLIEGIGEKFRYVPIKFEYNGTQLFSISKEDYNNNVNFEEVLNQKFYIRKTADGVSVSPRR